MVAGERKWEKGRKEGKGKKQGRLRVKRIRGKCGKEKKVKANGKENV